jgi:hypothetical protein
MSQLEDTSPMQKFFQSNRNRREIPYLPSKTRQEILRKSLLPFLPISGFSIPYKEMFAEAQRLIPAMVAHRADYESHSGWKSITLHGISSAHTQGAEKYGFDPEDNRIYQWTDIARLAPITTDFFRETFKYSHYHRVRFMLLEPGGYVMPHSDFDQYVLGPVNIALNNPDGCEFVMENIGVLPFSAGSILKLALVNRHAVINNSSEPRIHMIVHGAPDWEHWDNIICDSYESFTQTDIFLENFRAIR